MQRRIASILLALCMLFPTLPALAETAESPDAGNDSAITLTDGERALVAASQAEPINIGIIASSAPMCYWDEKAGAYAGIFMEILDTISEKTGLRFQYVTLDLQQGVPIVQLRQGNPDLVAGILKTPNFENDETLLLSDRLASDSLIVVGRRGVDILQNPAERTLAVLDHFQVASEYIAAQFPEYNVLYYNSLADCMEAVRSGRADATVHLESCSNYLLQNPHYEALEVLPAFSKDVETCIVGLAENKATLLSVINKGLAMMSETERNSIMINYTLLNPYRLTVGDMFYKYRLPLIVISILLVIVVVTLIVYMENRRKSAAALQTAFEQEKLALALAEKASAAKGSFMSRMSHEIRTPLNAVIGYNAIARRELSAAEDGDTLRQAASTVMDCLTKSDVASKHLLTIINDVLDVSAIESEKIKVAHEAFDFRAMLTALTSHFDTQAGNAGIRFSVDLDADMDEWFVGDSMRVSQILTNLLSNAVKFTPAGGSVTLIVRQQAADESAAHLLFTVKDTGIGMSEEYLAHIWAPFEQADASISRRFGGTGLGLTITKGLVDLMGGSIQVTSAQGVGTTFRVGLALARTQQPKRRPDAEEKRARYDFAGARVLLAEDNYMNMEIAKNILASTGLAVETAWNGEEALAKFTAAPVGTYQLILMDVQMPVMDGHEATVAIRASGHPEAGSIPIIAMTADAFAENVAEAIASGMNGHLSKPIDIPILFETLGKYIARK